MRLPGRLSLLGLVLLLAMRAGAAVWYVDVDSPGGGDGTSWATAFQNIQPAVEAAASDDGGEVWIAEGIYSGLGTGSPSAIALLENITLRGGFAGDETSLLERDASLHQSVLIGSRNSSYPVIGLASRSGLDSLYIQNSGMSGIACDQVQDVLVSNCTIRSNFGQFGGGASLSSSSDITFTSCNFFGNFAESGGGLFLVDCEDVLIDSCTLENNVAYGEENNATSSGGGITIENSVGVRLTNSLISENISSAFGGGMSLFRNDHLHVSACRFSSNFASLAGGGFSFFGANDYGLCYPPSAFTNCILDENSALNGSAIYIDGYEDGLCGAKKHDLPRKGSCGPCPGSTEQPSVVANCTFVRNTSLGGPTVEIYNSATPILNCVFLENSSPAVYYLSCFWDPEDTTVCGYHGPSHCLVDEPIIGIGNIIGSALFVSENDLRLRAGSPGIDGGIDSSFPYSGSVVTDYLGRARGLDGDGLGAGATGDGSDYDIGAFEYDPEAGEGEGEGEDGVQSADQDGDFVISLSELLRVIQFYNSGGLHCEAGTEDGFAPGAGDTSCAPYDTDYDPQDWMISLSEVLRVIQFYNSLGYEYCPLAGTEDGFCPGA